MRIKGAQDFSGLKTKRYDCYDMRYDCYEIMVDVLRNTVTIYDMGRLKRYETAAEKQKAYRARKRVQAVGAKVYGLEAKNPVYYTKSKIEELRELVKWEQEKPVTEAPVTPVGGIYRNDQGGVISKFAWEKLQRMKEEAKKGGYVLDEYSQ